MNTPASLGQRAIARCVDTVVLLLLTVGSLAGFAGKDAAGTTTFDAPPWWWLVLVFVGVISFEVVPVHVRGQTPGKILTRIRVVSIDTGANPSWRQAFVRWILPAAILLGLSPFVGLVVLPILAVFYGTALLDHGGRNLPDKLARTRVMQSR